MMEKLKDMAILIMAVMFVISLCFNASLCSREEPSPYHDTVRTIYTDTIIYYKPVSRDSVVIRYVTEKLPSADDKEEDFPITNDSSSVVIPITQKIYTDDSTYIAYVSGYQPALDSFMFLRKNITTTHICPTPKERKWSVGIQVGYGVTVNKTPQFTPYIGIGLSYKIFNF